MGWEEDECECEYCNNQGEKEKCWASRRIAELEGFMKDAYSLLETAKPFIVPTTNYNIAFAPDKLLDEAMAKLKPKEN